MGITLSFDQYPEVPLELPGIYTRKGLFMGTWSTSITGNDTAKDLYSEYSAAFYKYEPAQALEKIDQYIRSEMFDESDQEEWCNYYYSLADFMWKKGILTDEVRDKAIEMIDTGFGLELWELEGQKTLNARKKALAEFRKKLLSPQPPKKKIKPTGYLNRIFTDGDMIAVQLQTAGKPYTEGNTFPMSEEDFHALDGKYVIMQLVNCRGSWSSSIVPEVKDYWACFRLFDGIFDSVPEDLDFSLLPDAKILHAGTISSSFTCESSLVYFKRRNHKILCNRMDLLSDYKILGHAHIFWGINKPWVNPDSQLIAAMGKEAVCGEYAGTTEQRNQICYYANRYGRFFYKLSREENERIFAEEAQIIADKIDAVLTGGGKLYGTSFGRTVGIVTVDQGHIDNLYVEGQFQRNGLGTQLLQYALSVTPGNAYIDVPASNKGLLHICDKLGLIKTEETEHTVRMAKA